MSRPKPSAGFTLVELTLASAILTIAVAGAGKLLIGTQHAVRRTMAEAESSVRLRLLREKLLFHAEGPINGTVWSGLLSCASCTNTASGIAFDLPGVRAADGAADVRPLALTASGARFQEDRGWLCPGTFGYLADPAPIDTDALGQHLFAITLECAYGGIQRRQRLVVPLFGTLQTKNDRNPFHD